MLNKEQLQLFNDYKKVNNKIQGKPMTLGAKQEYKKRVSKLCKDKSIHNITPAKIELALKERRYHDYSRMVFKYYVLMDM